MVAVELVSDLVPKDRQSRRSEDGHGRGGFAPVFKLEMQLAERNLSIASLDQGKITRFENASRRIFHLQPDTQQRAESPGKP
jgi:hypothetical protein